MKRTLLFLAAASVAVSIAVACQSSIMCKQHIVEAEHVGTERTSDGNCVCIYHHELDNSAGGHTFKVLC